MLQFLAQQEDKKNIANKNWVFLKLKNARGRQLFSKNIEKSSLKRCSKNKKSVDFILWIV